MQSNVMMEKLIFNFIMKSAGPSELLKIKSSVFEDSNIKTIYSLISRFTNDFEKIPSKEQVKSLVLEKNQEFPDNEKIQLSLVDTLFDVDLSQYETEWLESSVSGTLKWKKFYEKLINTISYIKTIDKINPLNVEDYIDNCKTLLNTDDLSVFDNDDDLGSSFFEIETHFKNEENFITTNHQWVDQRMGGYTTGTLHVYCGFANIGKSIFLCNDAANYIKQGYDTLYISAEMAETSVNQRIGANILDISIDTYKDKTKESFIRKKMNDYLSTRLIQPGNLYVKQFPTSMATVSDIERYYLRMLERGLAPKVIVIDYINILASGNKSLDDNMYLKIKNIAEKLRAFAIKYDLVIITATQLNRSADEVSDIKLSNIAESQGLVHTADTMYGIIQTEEMKLNNSYWIKILRIREGAGKNHRCLYEIDYSRMRLTETPEVLEFSNEF